MTIAYVFADVHSFEPLGQGSLAGHGSGHEIGPDANVPRPLSEDETARVEQIRAGDHATFSAVFLAQYDGLCRFAESYTRNTADAEEIVDGVFARIWERHEEFAPSGSIAAYLYAAVRNRARNAVRDARSRTSWEAAHAHDLATESPPGMGLPPASMIAILEREELAAVLRRVIETLPEHRRAVVTMRWFGGLRHAEIATALGTSVNAVEIQLRRALKELAASAPAYLRD